MDVSRFFLSRLRQNFITHVPVRPLDGTYLVVSTIGRYTLPAHATSRL